MESIGLKNGELFARRRSWRASWAWCVFFWKVCASVRKGPVVKREEERSGTVVRRGSAAECGK